MKYEEYISESGQHVLRAVEHQCTDPECELCKKGSVAYLFNSVTYDQRRWVIAGVMSSDEKAREEFLNGMDNVELVDLYARFAALFGMEWSSLERDWKICFERCAQFIDKFSKEDTLLASLKKLDQDKVRYFKIPEDEGVDKRYDRIRTLLAFPNLYTPKKKAEKEE